MAENSEKNLVFFGTPEPAVEIFEHLRQAGFVPKLVVTNPDKPQGRKLKLTASPVKSWALSHDLPLLEPASPKDPVFVEKIKSVSWDLFIVVAYGSIISKELLAIPKHGALNVHYSLLPKYRGASPVESQILNDDKNTGVSIMLLDEKMDHGPILAQEALKFPIFNSQFSKEIEWPPTALELRKACNEVSGKLLAEIIPAWLGGKIKAQEQNHAQATYTKKITAGDRLIDLSGGPYKNFLKIQAFSAWGTYFLAERNGKKIRVNIARAELKDGKLLITRVIPEGKREMSYEDFLKGNRDI